MSMDLNTFRDGADRLMQYLGYSRARRPRPVGSDDLFSGLEKYRNDGWGISRSGFEVLRRCIRRRQGPLTVVEFGSGSSTQFLIDELLLRRDQSRVISFDNSPEYCFPRAKEFPGILELNLTNLLECDDKTFEECFEKKRFIKEKFQIKRDAPTARQRNCFYDTNVPAGLKCDLVLLDGPNGNGRSLAFLALKENIGPDTLIFVDDHCHYDFIERLQEVFKTEELYRCESLEGRFKWEFGGCFALHRVIGGRS